MTRTLVIASNLKLSVSLKVLLTYHGFNVTVASSITSAKKHLSEIHYSLMIVDIHNQNQNTFEFIKSLRAKGLFVPVLFMGENGYQESLQAGCSGLDEFLLRPFNYNALKRSLNKLLEKAHSEQRPLLFGGMNLDEKNRILWVKDKMVSLGTLEMKILLLLSKKAGRVVAIEKLYELVEKEGTRFNTKVFFHVSRLRYKLEEAGAEGLQINFVKDGYRLDVT